MKLVSEEQNRRAVLSPFISSSLIEVEQSSRAQTVNEPDSEINSLQSREFNSAQYPQEQGRCSIIETLCFQHKLNSIYLHYMEAEVQRVISHSVDTLKHLHHQRM